MPDGDDDRAKLDPRFVHAQRSASARERWGTSDDARMTTLARLFPSLAGADGVAPWDAHRLLQWALTPERSVPARHAVRFLLHVLDPARANPLGPFNFADAFRAWDPVHQQAVVAWCQTPFHP